MAGKNKTTAWNNVKWIKAHLPEWEKRGMTKGFLNSIISPKYKGCEADVESVLTCDVNLFETLYNQPDFLPKLKELCKKYRLPYGKVSQDAENKAQKEVELIYTDFTREKPLRADLGKFDSVKDTYASLRSKGYVLENRVKNLDELVEKCNVEKNKYPPKPDGRPNSYQTLSFNNGKVEALIDMIERGLNFKTIGCYMSLSPTRSIPKYVYIMLKAGIFKKMHTGVQRYFVDYGVVEFENGSKKKMFAVNDLFGE